MKKIRERFLKPSFISARVSAFLAACLLLPGMSFAFDETSSPAENGDLDVRILIDVSGSMKQNDPRNLRRSALELLIESIPDGSRAGVWTFGRQVNLLTPHEKVSDSWRERVTDRLRFINSVALRTNIGGALEEALYDSDPRKFPAAASNDRNIILLTDGVVDVDQDAALNDSERARILDEVIGRYREAGATIHTIALSTLADAELLETLAEETNGTFVVADEAEDLAQVFLSALESSAPSNQIPLHDNQFVIDKSVQEFSVVVFRNEADRTQLLDPKGQRYSESDIVNGVSWIAAEGYDLVTVEAPVSGQWSIDAAADRDHRVTVVSNLSIDVSTIEAQLYSDEQSPLVVKLTQDDATVIDNRFLNLVSVFVELEGIDDSNFAVPVYREELLHDLSNPGSFETVMLHPQVPGRYRVTVLVDGKTFERQKRFEVSVSPSFNIALGETDGNVSIVATANNTRWLGGDVRLQASVNDALGEMLATVPLSRITDNQWQGDYTLSASGAHTFSATAYRLNQKLPMKPVVFEAPPLFAPDEVSRPETEPVAADADEMPALDLEAVKETLSTNTPLSEVPVAQVVETAESVQTPGSAEVPEDIEDEGGLFGNWIVVSALVIGNLALIGGLYFVYRKLTADPLAESEEVDNDAEATVDELVDELEAEADALQAVSEQATENAIENDRHDTQESVVEITEEEQKTESVAEVIDTEQKETMREGADAELTGDDASPSEDSLGDDIDGLLDQLNDSLEAEIQASENADSSGESVYSEAAEPTASTGQDGITDETLPAETETDEEMNFDIEFDLSSDISEGLQQKQK